jgi:hypothetical protein
LGIHELFEKVSGIWEKTAYKAADWCLEESAKAVFFAEISESDGVG